MKKRLHELIEMAKRGEKFEAKMVDIEHYVSPSFFLCNTFRSEHITAEWTVRMKREPRVVWISEDRIKPSGSVDGSFIVSGSASSHSDLIKFIEVIDEP